MKLIQTKELDRICEMIKGDSEMQNIAVKLLRKKEPVRLSWSVIALLHSLILVAEVTGLIALCYRFKMGLYLIPAIMALLFLASFSVIHCILVWNVRVRYNKDMKKI
jgi:hypothetical protein